MSEPPTHSSVENPQGTSAVCDVVVIIPARNEEHRLPTQLEALDHQTDLDFRVVVSDNGSTDGTRQVCEQWEPRFLSIDVVDSRHRPGVAGARNTAIEATDEPLILICDADDRVHPTWVATMRRVLADAHGATGPLYAKDPEEPEHDHVWFPAGVPVSMAYRP